MTEKAYNGVCPKCDAPAWLGVITNTVDCSAQCDKPKAVPPAEVRGLAEGGNCVPFGDPILDAIKSSIDRITKEALARGVFVRLEDDHPQINSCVVTGVFKI